MNAINRTCFVLRVRPDRLEEYKARHRDVWPEMPSFFELPEGGRGGRADLSMIPLEEVFHLD